MIRGRAPVLLLLLASAIGCGAAPLTSAEPEQDEPRTPILRRRAGVADDCAQIPGKPPPKPLIRHYTGVAAKARCQREVYTIMGGLTHFLGVRCAYCHLEPDYAKITHRMLIANWMARELVPSLSKKGGGEVWCNDCHVVDGQGSAKILGEPRDRRRAIEWMTTHLVEDFETADGRPLRCKDCHQGNLGSREFQSSIILTDRLPRSARRAVDRAQEPAQRPVTEPQLVAPEPEEAPDSATDQRH